MAFMQYYKRKGTHTSIKLLAWNTEIKSIAKQKKKKSCKLYWVELWRFIVLDAHQQTSFLFAESTERGTMTRQRAQCPWEEGQGWKPCSMWRLLRNPAKEPELLSCASTLAEWHFNMCQGKEEREAAKPHYSHTPILQQKWTCHSGHKHLGTSLSVSRAQTGISFYAV